MSGYEAAKAEMGKALLRGPISSLGSLAYGTRRRPPPRPQRIDDALATFQRFRSFQ